MDQNQQPIQQLGQPSGQEPINQSSSQDAPIINQEPIQAPSQQPQDKQQETIMFPSLIQTISQQVANNDTAQLNDKQQQQQEPQQTVVQLPQPNNNQPQTITSTATNIPMTFPTTPTKAVVTQTVNLSQEMNIFEWFKTTDIINQIAERAKHSVDSVITTLDPGMKEYLFSGGNINIIVVTNHNSHISPIRDAFLSVFGRATIGPCYTNIDYPIKVALGYKGAIDVAKARINKLRQEASTFPQNQVVLVIQPTLVTLDANNCYSGDSNQSCNNEPLEWFFTYASIIDDPVLGVTLHTFSQLIPIDQETIVTLRDDESSNKNDIGFCKSLDEIMNTELKIIPIDQEDMTSWIKVWSGLEDKNLVHDSAISLAHSYQRKWNHNVMR